MKSAVLLCGGIGSRLSPITPTYTKSLIPVKGYKSNLDRIIGILFRSGVEDIVLVVPPDRLNDYRKAIDGCKNINLIANYKAYSCNNVTTFAVGICNLSNESDGCYFIDGDTYITSDYLPSHSDVSTFFAENREHEWGFIESNGKVVDFDKDCNGPCMTGVSYLDKKTIDFLRDILIKMNVNENDYWEEFLRKYLKVLDVHYQKVEDGFTFEYDNIVDLIKINGEENTIKIIPGVSHIYGKMDSMTNNNYLIDYNGMNRYIIRIPGVGSDELTHRQSEQKVHELIKDLQVTPKVTYIGTGSVKLKLSEYLYGFSNWKSIYETPYLYDILSKLKRIHRIGECKDVYYLNPFKEIEKYISLCNISKLSEDDVDKINYSYNRLCEYEDEFNSENRITLVHGDMINSNILVNGSDVFLIDFEYASNCDFNWDLGDLLSEMSIYDPDHILNKNEVIDFAHDIVMNYNNISGELTNSRLVILWGALTHFIWSIWGFARYSMGDDQLEYAHLRMNECNKFLDIVGELDEK